MNMKNIFSTKLDYLYASRSNTRKNIIILKKFIILTILVLTILSLFMLAVQADVWVKGYYKKDGTYVKGHWRSSPDSDPTNNFSYPGNVNPYTGKVAPGNPETYLKNYPNYSKKPNVNPIPIPKVPTNNFLIEKQEISLVECEAQKKNIGLGEYYLIEGKAKSNFFGTKLVKVKVVTYDKLNKQISIHHCYNYPFEVSPNEEKIFNIFLIYDPDIYNFNLVWEWE